LTDSTQELTPAGVSCAVCRGSGAYKTRSFGTRAAFSKTDCSVGRLKNIAQVHVPVFPSFGSRRVASVEMHSSLPSQVAAILPFVDQLMWLIAACRGANGSEFDVEIALREAITNAVVHGNREDPEKRVEVACRCGADGSVDITTRDQRHGFDSRTIPDPTVPESRMALADITAEAGPTLEETDTEVTTEGPRQADTLERMAGLAQEAPDTSEAKRPLTSTLYQ